MIQAGRTDLLRRAFLVPFVVAYCCVGIATRVTAQATATEQAPQTQAAQTSIESYIAAGWQTLSRSMAECKSVVDPKVTTVPVLYLPAGLATPAAVTAMQQQCRVEVRHLPRAIHHLGEVRPTELPVGTLRLDPAARRAWRDQTEISLSPKEFALLEAFMRRPGHVLSRLQLLEHAWDFAYENRWYCYTGA